MNERTRLASLLARMTLREKIGQLCQANGTADDHKKLVKQGRLGSILNGGDVATINEFQRVAVEESRLGIPLIFGRDVIHGFHTVFPIPLGQAAMWNPAVVEQSARAAAREATSTGVRWTFAPMVDVARDPRWGRIAEGGGEDPFLASALGVAMVRGFQGADLSHPESLAACAKHYAGYGLAEGGRDYNTADVSENTFRNVHLRPFAACVDAGVATLMSAFNEINGIPASANPWTLRQVLRREWGFDGFVVSDWASIFEMIAHGFCADKRAAALAALTAGVDMEMASTCYAENLEKLIRDKKLPVRIVNESVANILRIKHRLGLFDCWHTVPARQSVLLCQEHLGVAREAARQSLVLLSNDGTLPLRPTIGSVAVIGPLADNGADQLGCWVMDQKAESTRTPLAAIREIVTRVNYAPGLVDPRATDAGGLPAAVKAARAADAVVLFLGEPAILSGEAHSRAFLDLPGAQRELFDAIVATGKPVVVVLMAGRPLTVHWLFERANAVLMAWHPGTMGGPAIADVIFGAHAPCGKLPVSWPRTVGQIPLYYNQKNTGRPPQAVTRNVPIGTPLDPVGFCANYLDVEHTPAFPFGFGLSYTRFEYRDLIVTPKRLRRGGQVRVSARVVNTGKVAGAEVVQLYVRDLVGSVTRPVKELAGFRRITLAPGESQVVTFELTTNDLAFWNAANKRVAEPGKFQVWIAGDSASGEPVTFELVGK